MNQILIQPDDKLYEKILALSKERDWALKKTVERVCEHYFGIKTLEEISD